MKTYCILFYKYTPLSSDKDVMTLYQNAMKKLCTSLNLTGRVLIGMSDNAEGLNGTLAGIKENVLCYTYVMLGKKWCIENDKLPHDGPFLNIMMDFFDSCEEFSKVSNVDIPKVDTPEDFKWSSSDEGDEELFPDLQIKLVKEIISTGGVLSSISIDETSKDYLTPEEWHYEMQRLGDPCNKTVLIDCRNHKEFAVGHFEHAIDPNTKIFSEFPLWVKENKTALKDKKVLMYCTGGIRCEKASAYIRNELKNVSSTGSVHHLKGGIHKYLDKYASDGYFRGKNFVFDRRLTMDADEHKKNNETYDEKTSSNYNNQNTVVGRCQYCDSHYDNFTGDRVCTVCRELALVCEECKSELNGEFHCIDHMHLRTCYFTNLANFNTEQLELQLKELQIKLGEIAVGKRYKQKRNTLLKQCERIKEILNNSSEQVEASFGSCTCRSCGDVSCDGNCWGVHGLKRKNNLNGERMKKVLKAPRENSSAKQSKIKRKEIEIEEIKRLSLSEAPNVHRDDKTSLRCPPPCIKFVSSSVKGKWCGRTIKSVIASEFHEFSNTVRLEQVFKYNLIYIDNIPVNSEEALKKGTDANKALSPDTLLKNMDTISRCHHWHEPPVIVPSHIEVKRIHIPKIVCDELIQNFEGCDDDRIIYCCNKPASVPVHPAGPYYQNSLLLMIEAQEELETKSLIPCHRLDRCTSGLTICCSNSKLARLIQVQMDLKAVSKLYLARVKGKFPSNKEDCNGAFAEIPWSWSTENQCVEVNAPIALDVTKGLRGVVVNGKVAQSRFKFIQYDDKKDISIIFCFPLTGRQHQLRVHLQALGYPIHNDILYGGMVDGNNKAEMLKNTIQAMTKAAEHDRHYTPDDGRMTKQTIQDAKEFCLCCQGESGIKQSFNSAQLLVEGHQIDLHALAYRIHFQKKEKERKKAIEINKSNQRLPVLEMHVKSPLWADSILHSDLCWLDKSI